MEKVHKILLSAMAVQTLVLGGLVLMVKPAPAVVRETQTVEVVVTPTPTPRLLGATGKEGRVASPSSFVR